MDLPTDNNLYEVIVCTECWHDIPAPRFSREDGPLVCPHCGACDPATVYMSVAEFEDMESNGGQLPTSFIKRRIGEIEDDMLRINRKMTDIVKSGDIIAYGDQATEYAFKVVEIRATLFEYREMLRRRGELK